MQTIDINVYATPHGASFNDGLDWGFSSDRMCSKIPPPCLDFPGTDHIITLPRTKDGPVDINFHLRTSSMSWEAGPYAGNFNASFLVSESTGSGTLQIFQDEKKQSAYSGPEFGTPKLSDDPTTTKKNMFVGIHDNNTLQHIYGYTLNVGIMVNGKIESKSIDPKIRNGGVGQNVSTTGLVVIALVLMAIAAFIGWRTFRAARRNMPRS